ncbi:MAG: hypothetical protein U9R79_04380 [Armatimonadota bacterium]|nr:hypothetical protein [Armatimonadota bacterium]
MNARWMLLAGVALLAFTAVAQEEVRTLLRHDNFVVFEAEEGERVPIAVASLRKAGWTYGDNLTVEVIGPTSERTLRQVVPLGEQRVIEYQAQATGTHAVRLSAGWNNATAQVQDRPWALVAWRDVPVNICSAMAPQYFKVLEGLERFKMVVEASVTGEGAAVRIYDPQGNVALERIADFDSAETLEVEVPEGMDGSAWMLTITDPEQEGLNLDDVQLYLGPHLPPFLCEDPAWLEPFTAGEQYQPDIIERVVEIGGEARLNAGESTTLTWQMQELPEGKVYALRITGNDVDYPRELMATLNGGEPFAIPITGNSTSATFTLLIDRDRLRLGENTLGLTQDPGGGSNVVVASDARILIGERIKQFKGY